MNINLVNIEEANFITHNGGFHCDELFCTVILSELFNDFKLCRTRDINNCDNKAIMYDIGLGKFDHHQDNVSYRNNKVMYASFGLIWKEYGVKYLNKHNIKNVNEVFEYIDYSFICPLDNYDNGFGSKSVTIINICDIVEKMNPLDDEDENECFIKAYKMMYEIFNREVVYANKMIIDRKITTEAINNSKDGILVLNERAHWEETLYNSNDKNAKKILYVIKPLKDKGYSVHTVSEGIDSFVNKLSFPKEWLNKTKEELSLVSGIKTLTFCHKAGFLCIVGTLDDAIKCAKESIRIGNNK